MKPEYILEKVEDKATLYHLKVKDNNNLMVETNLFFDLKKHSWAYNSFVISQSDDEYIHNFKGLIIEPSNLSVDINVDVSSKISILKADQGVLGKEGLSIVKLPDEPVTLLINKALDFKASDHAGIFFNQDSKVEIDRLSFERNTEFSLLYIAPVKKLSSLYIKDANFSTIYAKSPIKEMNLQDFNKDSKVVANLYIEADKSNKVINKVEAFNASFDRLSNADNIVKAKIGVNKELELINTTINGNEYDHTISGHIDTFSSKGATIFLDGNFKIENKGNEIAFLANGISINNSTIKNTLSLTNALILNADIDNLVLENKGKDYDSFLVQTSTVNGDKKSQGRITLDNCIVNVDNRFSINIYGNFSASNSNFFGTNIFCSALEDSNFLFFKGDVNLDINIVNSSFKNVELYAAGLLSNKEWEDPDYRQTLTICGSELTGENELRETTLVLHSVLQNISLANASEIKNSFLKEIIKNYKMPTIIEEVNLAANEPKKDVGQATNGLEIL